MRLKPSLTDEEVSQFAEKHGLTERAAAIILVANGPDVDRCDAAARAFNQAKRARAERSLDQLF